MRLYFLLVFLAFLGTASAQPVITVNHHTIPDSPSPGDFILSIDLVNSGSDAKNVKLHIFENEEALSILSDGKEVSSVYLTLGDLSSSSTSAQVKLKAEKSGIFQLGVKINYIYADYLYEGSVNRIIVIKVTDEPEFSVSGELSLKPAEKARYCIEILNTGGKATDVSLSLDTPENVVTNVGRVVFDEWNSGEKKNFEFSLTADDSVLTGVYKLNLIIEYKNEFGEQRSEIIPIALKIAGTPEIVISNFQTIPERVYPENEFSILFEVENSGTDDAKNVTVELETSDYFEGEKTKFLGSVERGELKQLSFNLKAKNNTPYGDSLFILRFSYSDNAGNKFSSEYKLPVYVSSPGKISLDIAGIYTSPEIPVEGGNYKLSIQIENSGSEDAKAVSIQLLLPSDFEGKDSYFIGSLESGDSATASFNLKAGSAGNHNIKAVIRYMDSRFEKHEITKSFTQYISGRSYTLEITGVLITLLVIIFAFTKLKK